MIDYCVNKVTNVLLVAGVMLAALCGSLSAVAEVSYNVGFASEYHFRGVKQKTSSASAGVDYEKDGFYVGSWAADVGDGLEVDGYFGYGIETDGGLSASVGFTGYYYTGEFDDTYQEINLNLGYSYFGLEFSVGEYDGFGEASNYHFLAATAELGESGFYATAGFWGDDFDGEYLEVGYGVSVADIDFGVAVILSSDELSDQLDSDGDATESESIVFTIGKTF